MMRKRKTKTVSRLVLALVILVMILPLGMVRAQAEGKSAGQNESLPSIEEQIRAYADSIDQSNAVNAAASTLAVHGMTMGGKKLTMDEDNALTAVLMNSELVQAMLIEGFAPAFDSMQQLDLAKLPYIYGWAVWHPDDYYLDAMMIAQFYVGDIDSFPV